MSKAPFPKTYFASEFVCLIAASILYGVTMVQAIFYYTTYHKDSFRLKTLVALLWALDFAQLIFTAQPLFSNLILNVGNARPLFISRDWALISVIFTTAVIALVVESSLILRVWRVGNNRPVTVYLCLVTIGHLSLAIVVGAAFNYHAALAAAGIGLVADLSITTCMVYFLRRRRTGIKTTDKLVHFLIIYAVNGGMITSVASLVGLVLAAALPTTLEYFSFRVVISKAYTNTFLGTLNARKYIKERANTESEEPQRSNFRMRHIDVGTFSVSLEADEVLHTYSSKGVEESISRGLPSITGPTLHSQKDV